MLRVLTSVLLGATSLLLGAASNYELRMGRRATNSTSSNVKSNVRVLFTLGFLLINLWLRVITTFVLRVTSNSRAYEYDVSVIEVRFRLHRT